MADHKLPSDADVRSWIRDRSNWGRWGKDDQLGALNLVTPAKRVAAMGEPGNELFIIVDGRAVVTTRGGRTTHLGPGDFFGEMSLIDGDPRSATVEATTPMRLFVLGYREFWQLLDEELPIVRKIMRALSRRLRLAEKSLQA